MTKGNCPASHVRGGCFDITCKDDVNGLYSQSNGE